ncbi:MAG: LPS assembly protein LptD [Alphaproteobacteria bacterium]|nr:LPS assembly protein LptD [Alphaproteobacteria bacterium]
MGPFFSALRARARIGRLALASAVVALIAASWPLPAGAQGTAPGQAQPPKRNAQQAEPYVILRADEVTFEEKTGIATATGNVEIAQGDRMLRADKIVYVRQTDTFKATGNVAVVEPNGDVIFGENGEFTNRFKDGFINGFSMLFADNSRLAAAGARRVGGVVTSLGKGVFSPCELCKEDPSRAPLWRVRAVRVVHDNVRKEVEYKDAYLEMFGVPVLYLPYFSHADPSVKRRTGFLIPSYSSSSEFGSSFQVPYFWAIDPSEDITLTPNIYSGQAPMLAAEYRKRFVHGEIQVEGSYTRPERDTGADRETRGHLFVEGRHDIDPMWRAKYQLQQTSDDTYMRRYKFDEPDNQTLTSSFNLEGFKGHNYAQVSGYHFKGLRATDVDGEIPFVIPFAEYHFVSHPSAKGAYLTADASLLTVQRAEGTDSRRVSIKGGWHLPYTAPSGEVYELSANMQGDLYWFNDSEVEGESFDGTKGRIFPQIMAKWRYPFVRKEKNGRQLIEPVVAVVLAPNGGNPKQIPNEDSQDVEFDDTNIFSASRFTGVDRVDGGQRVVAGLNWGLYGDKGGAIEAFIGQSYRLSSRSAFPSGSGLTDHASDVVGRLRVSPGDYLDLLYRFRMDTDNWESRRRELKLVAGPSWLKANVDYFFVRDETGTGEFGNREEVSLRLDAALTKYWSANARIREDLTGTGTISEGLGFTYQDECFIFDISFERTFTEDRDLRPEDTIFFKLIFKHLGEIKATS